MTDSIAARVPADFYRCAGFAALAVLALTTIHHIYGAIIYDTPWRFHIAIVAPVLALAIVRALYLGGSRQGTPSGKLWTMVAAALILIFPVGLIGLVEGGYNHLVKNLAYFAAGEPMARALFPAPAYEMPGDFLFEATGIAQLPLGLLAAWSALAIQPFRRGLAA